MGLKMGLAVYVTIKKKRLGFHHAGYIYIHLFLAVYSNLIFPSYVSLPITSMLFSLEKLESEAIGISLYISIFMYVCT